VGARDVDSPGVDAGGEDDTDATGDRLGVVLAKFAPEVKMNAEPTELGLEVGDRRPVVLLPGDQARPTELASELLPRLIEVNLPAERGEHPRRLQPRGPATDHDEPPRTRPGGDGEIDLVAGAWVHQARHVPTDQGPIDARLVAADAHVHHAAATTLLHDPRICQERP